MNIKVKVKNTKFVRPKYKQIIIVIKLKKCRHEKNKIRLLCKIAPQINVEQT
jgi:hypothetical protein